MISKLCLSFALLAASATPAADKLPKAGSYGFNWLDPANSECKPVTEKDIATFKECTISDNAFGIELRSHACKVDERTEIIVYANAEQCQQGLETMQANGD
jgi:hypothetical protein